MAEPLTRKRFVQRSGIAALATFGLYGLLDTVATAPARAAVAGRALPPEQHLMRGLGVISDNGVKVVMPPLHHQIVTARLTSGASRAQLLPARQALEDALRAIERELPPTPSGLGLSVGWGLPYFRRLIPQLADGRRFPDYLPRDRHASKVANRPVPALLESVRFASDPPETVLERNDLVFVLQSDSQQHIAEAATALFGKLHGLVQLTSIRKGFVGGGYTGQRSLPKAMAMSAGIAGAQLIPETAQLFLGFTSTQSAALGPDRIANFETLPGLTDQWPHGYFRNGTTLTLSHLYEDIEKWYTTQPFGRRLWLAHDLDRGIPDADTQTLPMDARHVQAIGDLKRLAVDGSDGGVGHSGAIQTVNRLPAALRDNYGVLRPRGTAILQRADFNTLDNPFYWTSQLGLSAGDPPPAAGLHFAAYSPTSDLFHRMRRAMDGRLGDGSELPIDARSERMGLNSVLRTTHRQNFLVPPRRHRAFPLVELL